MRMVLTALLLAVPVVAAGGKPAAAPSSRVEPDVERPLAWLVAAQNPDGSWGADARSQAPDVATTAIAGIALIRMGHTGSQGEFQENTRRAVESVASAVLNAPPDQIAVQAPGTLPQRKLGRNIDTFVAAQFLAEVVPTLPSGRRARAQSALADCIRRIERAQAADGSFAQDGWAPVLANAFAADALHAAAAAGAAVDEKKLARADASLMGKYDEKTKSFDTRSSAGVDLYSAAASIVAAARVHEAAPASPEADPQMQRKAEAVAQGAGARFADERMMRGFGSYGGEEHVSYMLTAEAKAAVGGDTFAAFRKQMLLRLAQIQREDGTWRGDHCITSTTFCTAASLITMAVRAHASGHPS